MTGKRGKVKELQLRKMKKSAGKVSGYCNICNCIHHHNSYEQKTVILLETKITWHFEDKFTKKLQFTT